MSIEELLKPRVKITAPWPGMEQDDYSVGQIITGEEKDLNTDLLERFPNLFRKLEWWEERKPEDMPAFVKWIGKDVVEPAWRWETWGDTWKAVIESQVNSIVASYFLPATEAEYNEYSQQKQST